MVRTNSADASIEKILKAAHALVLERGVQALTMAEIAHYSQLSRPALYQYFKSREHVLAELLTNEMADLANSIDEKMMHCNEPMKCISIWVDSTLDFYISPSHALVQDISIASLPEESRGVIKALHGQFMTSLVAPVAALREEEITEFCGYIFALVVEAARNVEKSGNRDEVRNRLMHFITAALT